jgi:MFS family permease
MAEISTSGLRTGLRIVTAAWMLGICWQFATSGTVIFAASGTTMAVFGRRVGLTDFHFGILAMLPFLGTLAQPVASYFLERRRNRKGMFLWWLTHNRWPWVLVALCPFVLPAAWVPVAVLLLVGMMSTCGALGTPAWVSWMADFVPRKRRGKYFATRAQYAMCSLGVAVLTVGLLLDWAEQRGTDYVLWTCSGILAVAAILGTIDIQSFRWVPEPKMTPARSLPAWRQILSEPLRDRSFRPLLVHFMSQAFAICILGPFIMLHCLTYLEFSNLAASVIVGMFPPLGYVLGSRIWGMAMDRWGRKPVLYLTLGLCSMSACGWFLAGPGDVVLAAVVCLLAGVFWSGLETANFNLILGYTGSERSNGSSYQALLAVAMSAAGVTAGLIGGALAQYLSGAIWHIGPIFFNNYMVLLAISIGVRLMDMVLIVPAISDCGATETRAAIRMMIAGLYQAVNTRMFYPLRGRTNGGNK